MPLAGPEAPPVTQTRDEAHQPQSAWAAQSLQEVWVRQGSVVPQLCHIQSGHGPVEELLASPVMHWPREAHHPQLGWVAQVSQEFWLLQGSVVSQNCHFQSEQTPVLCPVGLPVWQELVGAHHPQLDWAEQAAQVV